MTELALIHKTSSACGFVGLKTKYNIFKERKVKYLPGSKNKRQSGGGADKGKLCKFSASCLGGKK